MVAHAGLVLQCNCFCVCAKLARLGHYVTLMVSLENIEFHILPVGL